MFRTVVWSVVGLGCVMLAAGAVADSTFAGPLIGSSASYSNFVETNGQAGTLIGAPAPAGGNLVDFDPEQHALAADAPSPDTTGFTLSYRVDAAPGSTLKSVSALLNNGDFLLSGTQPRGESVSASLMVEVFGTGGGSALASDLDLFSQTYRQGPFTDGLWSLAVDLSLDALALEQADVLVTVLLTATASDQGSNTAIIRAKEFQLDTQTQAQAPTTVIPTPTAAVAGLSLLGMMGLRRRR